MGPAGGAQARVLLSHRGVRPAARDATRGAASPAPDPSARHRVRGLSTSSQRLLVAQLQLTPSCPRGRRSRALHLHPVRSREREDLVREPAGWAGRAHGARREPVQGVPQRACRRPGPRQLPGGVPQAVGPHVHGDVPASTAARPGGGAREAAVECRLCRGAHRNRQHVQTPGADVHAGARVARVAPRVQPLWRREARVQDSQLRPHCQGLPRAHWPAPAAQARQEQGREESRGSRTRGRRGASVCGARGAGRQGASGAADSARGA
mmetsp:Transcript_27963/g.66054  ORF Transcript_27963/g.66054 Transcript_27963/m.66054 type:complete len:266 (-) Transcript_27963:816-1613(-)